MTVKQNAYGQAIISGSDTAHDEVQAKINARKQPPTEDQINGLKRYLRDFKIKVHIPEFTSVSEMDLWKIRQVKSKLGC